ncbi:MAG: hypothetical protein HZA79_08510 [Sphingobacteriales bacterium]|nr:hypothetical protein [Sphingobacteriales bacterium]
MRKTVLFPFFLLLRLWPVTGIAQPVTVPVSIDQLKVEQSKLVNEIGYAVIDSAVMKRLLRFAEFEVDSLGRSVLRDSVLADSDKAKGVQSLYFFTRKLRESLFFEEYEIFDIPDVLDAYMGMLDAFLFRKPYRVFLKNQGAWSSQLLAGSFSQYREYEVLKDMAVFNREAASPSTILQYLEAHRGFRFEDSLLLLAAAHYPMKLIPHLLQQRPGIQELILRNRNKYLQQLVSISGERNAPELVPFLIPLAEKRISIAAILEAQKDPGRYFKLLVNTLKEELSRVADSSVHFLIPLRDAIKEKAAIFFVSRMNELHGVAEKTRFRVLDGLRAEDIYYIITESEGALFTSSYLGLYRRLMEQIKTSPADSIFGLLNDDNFRPFIRMAANHNILDDFLRHMPPDSAIVILKRYVAGIESDKRSGLANAMDLADSFAGFSTVPGARQLMQHELAVNYDRCQSGKLYLGIRLYRILQQVFGIAAERGTMNPAGAALGNYDRLERKQLQHKSGNIIQFVLFYGDEDGIASFSHFMKLFRDKKKWEIAENPYWVSIHSRIGQPLAIYASRPLDITTGKDLQAQDSLAAFLRGEGMEPAILIHRGHSFHLSKTLKWLRPNVKLLVIGSCGGYNNILSIADISPGTQIIVSKKIGTQLINDPMIELINESLRNKEDLIWAGIWEKLTMRFRKNAYLQNLFADYIPPGKNLSLFVLHLFNKY